MNISSIMWKKAFLRGIAILALLSIFGCSSRLTAGEAINELEITVFKIGKADSILLTIGENTLLIDTGEDEDGKEVLKYLQDKNISSIDYMIITHFDKDHVGGADTILNRVKVEKVITPNYETDTKEYRDYVKAMKSNGLTAEKLIDDKIIKASSAELTIYPPKQDSYDGDNDYSLIISMKHGKNSFLFAADAEEARLLELMQQGNLEHTFLKVPHHGKNDPMNEKFFMMVKPKYAVITSSETKREKKRVVAALKDLGAKVYVTRQGEIHVRSNGENIEISQSE